MLRAAEITSFDKLASTIFFNTSSSFHSAGCEAYLTKCIMYTLFCTPCSLLAKEPMFMSGNSEVHNQSC